MAIIKVLKRENPYVQIDKTGIDDPNLSWEATGLLTYLVGRPNNWKVNVMHLSSVKKNKETSTRKALLELRKYNYCHLFEIRKGGKYIEKFYLVFEVPTQYDEISSNIDIELKEEEKIRLAQMLEGNERIENWCEQVEYVGEKEFKKVVKMLKNWLEEITNSFDYEYNNGYLEGKHNKIKTLKRVSFRMDNFESFRNRILLT